MSQEQIDQPDDPRFATDNFTIFTLQDEILADQLCEGFLRLFYTDMVKEGRLSPAQASPLAYGASFFLREFIIPDRRENIFRIAPGRVRQFAGNWYIVNTLEPNMTDLGNILQGVRAFYDYCHRVGKVSAELFEEVIKECVLLDYYAARIEAFWAITGDGFEAWNRACSLDR